MSLTRINRARGCLLGLAVGDAIGTTVEFKARGTFSPVTDMTGGGPFDLKKGEWTDDTSMALCLGASLLATGFNKHDQMSRYLRWYHHGYFSSNGRCFDIGMTTRSALHRYEADGNPNAGSSDSRSAGNGCIMRLAPVPIMFMDAENQASLLSAEQSMTTHAATECLEASWLFGGMLVRALQGQCSKQQILLSNPNENYPISSRRLQAIAKGEYFESNIDEIRGSGYVVDSLEAALWCFYSTDNFKGAILAAANLGDDADTTAAITGQIAGAYYGESAIPKTWLECLVMATDIGEMAERLAQGKFAATSGRAH